MEMINNLFTIESPNPISAIRKKYLEKKCYEQIDERENFLDSKNYYRVQEGFTGTELSDKATKIGDTLTAVFNENIQKLDQHNDAYQNTLINGKNTVELYLNVVEDHDHLSESVSKDSNIVLVNERKTYYEEQGINNLFWWKAFWNRIYLVLFLSFIIVCFLFSKMSWIQIGGLIILFGIFPYSTGFLISGGRWMREQWNQNVGIVYQNMYVKM